MSDKPKIYGNCKAGCLWETVHKDDFDRSATWIKQYADEDGVYKVSPIQTYKINSPVSANAYSCAVSLVYWKYSSFTGLTTLTQYDFAITEFDEYRDYFYFEILDIKATSTSLTIVYEVNGNRYKEILQEHAFLTNAYIKIASATSVYLFNADASISADLGEGGGGGSVEVVQEKGTSTTAVMSQNAVTTEINDLWAAINYVAPTISTFTRTPSTSSYKLPATYTLTKITHSETNIANIVGNLTLKRGSTVIKSDITPSATSADVTVSDTVTLTTSGVAYTLSGTDKNGNTFSKTATIAAYYTSYFGASENSTVSNTLIAGLTDTNSSSLTGTRSVTISGTSKYVWFISTKAITSIKSSGFAVPYTLVNGSYTYNGTTYKCYRTTEKVVAGENTFVIV
jgi:hypothetical protein